MQRTAGTGRPAKRKNPMGNDRERSWPSRNLFRALLLLVTATTFAQDRWVAMSSPTRETLRTVFFADSLHGWAAGTGGAIVATTDGGWGWEVQPSGLSLDIVDLFFLDARTGWALAWNNLSPPFGTLILSTTDGGNTWHSTPFIKNNILLHKICFFDTLSGWVGGSQGSIYQTANGGLSWQKARLDSVQFSQFPVLSLGFTGRKFGFAGGGVFDIAGVIWRSTDAGEFWQVQPVGPEPIQDLHIFDSLNVIGVGGDFEFGSGVVTTADGGKSWEYRSLQVFGIAWAISFRTAREAWAPLGTAGRFIFTLDAGKTWQPEDAPGQTALFDVFFVDSLRGFAVGDSGTILRYQPPLVGVPAEPAPRPDRHRLSQNFPNPFNPVTHIDYWVARAGRVTLRLFDLHGREAARLVSEYQRPGRYRVTFSAENLPAGVYFYRLQVGGDKRAPDFTETKKMLLIR